MIAVPGSTVLSKIVAFVSRSRTRKRRAHGPSLTTVIIERCAMVAPPPGVDGAMELGLSKCAPMPCEPST
jgi:hypothetical protein